MIRSFLIALAVAASSAAVPAVAAAAADAPLYSVRFRLHGIATHDDSQPSLTARAGEPATVMIGNDSYTLRIVTTTDAERRVDVDAEVSFWTPAGLRYVQNQVALTANGETGQFAFPATDPSTGETRDVRVELSVVPIGD